MRFKSGDIVKIEWYTAINLDLVGKMACVSGITPVATQNPPSMAT